MDVIEAMESCSAARYLKSDPVPQDLIERVIYAATRASSPGNSQERATRVESATSSLGRAPTRVSQGSPRMKIHFPIKG